MTSVAWLSATFLTRPTDEATLVAFYRKVRPAGPGWRAVAALAGGPPPVDRLGTQLRGAMLGCGAIYGALFGSGSLLYGRTLAGVLFLAVSAVCTVLLVRLLPRIWTSSAD